jgi:hypothetical protein
MSKIEQINLQTLFFNAFASRPQPPQNQIIRKGVDPHESQQLCQLLASKRSTELTHYELQTVVESNLWMLTPEAFLYFLPAFLDSCVQYYSSISVFASELIGTLTEPSRTDIIESFNHITQSQSGLRLPDDMIELLKKQQLEWFDSGSPTVIFYERFNNVTNDEGRAILKFFEVFQELYDPDFPFNELGTAVERYWIRYQDS